MDLSPLMPPPPSSLSLVKIDTSVTYSLEGFVALQEECLSRAVEGLQRLREEIAAVIVTSCKVSKLVRTLAYRT